MQKVNTAPLSGFMELLPEDQMEFDRIKQVILNAHHRNGFVSIDMPLVYRDEVLLAKAGGETEKQIYRVSNGLLGENGGAGLALRFDHTVPLATYVAENQGQLVFPFKVSNIGKNYRGERAQKGRYREFYQCDCDVIGRGDLDVAYDAEVIGVICEIYRELDFGKFTIRVSNRKLLNGFLEGIGLEGEKLVEVGRIIDGAEKVSVEELLKRFNEAGMSSEQIEKVRRFIAIKGESDEIVRELSEFGISGELFGKGIEELKAVVGLLEKKGMGDCVKVDLMIVRGLDYYTGTVYEAVLDGHPEIGSISGGGRYDNLTGNYTNERFQGVGASIGLTRLFYVLKEAGIVGTSKRSLVDVAIVPFGEEQFEFCYKLAGDLKSKGKNVDVLLQDAKLGKKLACVDKSGVENVIVVGEDEVATGKAMVKNMASGAIVDLDEWLRG